MIGTVPVYDSVIHYQRDLATLTAKDFIDVVRIHAEDGVDFVTLHCGITRKTIEQIKKHKRKMNIVSRGGEAVNNDDSVSKEAVKDLLHKTKFPANFQIPENKKKVDYLYIDADEDHFSLQFKEKKGDLEKNEKGRKLNGAITKLIYVYEGIEPDAPKSKRNHLVNPHYFCRGTDDNTSLWDEVYAYIDATYDISSIKKIYLNSDGGAWIKAGFKSVLLLQTVSLKQMMEI